jgi:methyl-accepting chemotaxis protein
MGNLGKLNIVISAVNKTQKVFNTVKRGLDGVKNAVGKALKAFGMLTAGIGAVAGALTVLFKKSFDYIDVIGKIASRTGATTDVIQAFQLSAIQSGASIETANKAIQKFAKMVGEGRKGLKTYTDIFDRYNVSLMTATGEEKSFNEVLFQMMEGMKQSGDIFLRNADLALLFGRAGQELTNTILMGGKAFELYVEKQKELGLILDGKTISATEAFNDRLSRIGFTFRVIRDAITTAFLPALDKIADHFETTLSEINAMQLGRNIAVSIVDGVIASLQALDDFRMQFQKTFRLMVATVETLSLAFDGLGHTFNVLALIFGRNIDDFKKRFHELTESTGKSFENIFGEIVPSKSIQAGITNLNKLRESLNLTLGDADGKNPIDTAKDKLTGFEEKLRQMVADIQTPLSTFGESFKTTGTMIGDTIVSSMKKFEDTIVDGLMKGKLSFKDFADFVIKELLRIAIRKFVIESMFNAITGGLGSLFGKKGMAGFVGDINTAGMPVAEGGGFTGFGSRTGGVDGRGGFPAILHPNETVIDHRKGGRGGMPINITYNIQAFDSRDTLQAITENAPTISAIIESEFNKRGRRGFVT